MPETTDDLVRKLAALRQERARFDASHRASGDDVVIAMINSEIGPIVRELRARGLDEDYD